MCATPSSQCRSSASSPFVLRVTVTDICAQLRYHVSRLCVHLDSESSYDALRNTRHDTKGTSYEHAAVSHTTLGHAATVHATASRHATAARLCAYPGAAQTGMEANPAHYSRNARRICRAGTV